MAGIKRHHLEALAAALGAERPMRDAACRLEYAQWEADVAAVAGVCAQFNPEFDPERWRRSVAGGGGGGQPSGGPSASGFSKQGSG